MTYIEPNLRVFSTLEEAAEFFGARSSTAHSLLGIDSDVSLDDVARGNRNLIVGEPGIGKSLLLKKLEGLFQDRGEPHLRVRLKDQKALEEATEFCRKSIGQPRHLMLDALDEVSSRAFPEALRTIEELSAQNPQVSMYLSSRWVFVRRYAISFPSYRVVVPMPFSRSQVREYLKAEGRTEVEIDSILGRVLSFDHSQLVIQVPRYLAYLTAYLKDKGADAASRVSRNELFEYFIYSKLDLEDERLSSDRKAILKRVLEKLALVMEIYQENSITKDELMTFFDEVHSDLKLVALAQIPLNEFFDASLLKLGHEDPDRVEFENSEFQEYLAAKEITRFPDPNRAAFRFAVDDDAREIYPSWFNALTFLVDMEPSLLAQLVEFSGIRSERLKVVDDALLTFLGRLDIAPLAMDQRRALFADIVSYHQRGLQWLSWGLGPLLARLFDPSLEASLKGGVAAASKEAGTRRFVPLGNIAHVVGVLLEGDALLDRRYWRDQLLAFTKDTNENGGLQENALFALGALGDQAILDEVPDLSNAGELIGREFFSMCRTLSANHPKSIDYCLKALQRGNFDGRVGLTAITARDGIKRLLQALAADGNLRHTFLDHSRIVARDDDRLAASIDATADDEILVLSEEVLLRSLDHGTGSDVANSRFLFGLWNLLNRRRAGFLADFTARIARSPSARATFYFLRSLAASTLQPSDVAPFITAMVAAGEGGIVSILAHAKAMRGSEGEAVFEAGREHLPQEYEEWEAHQRELSAKKLRESQALLERFQTYLEPQPGSYSPGVFEFFNVHEKDLGRLISADQRARLTDLIIGTAFKFIDPITHKLTITEARPGGGTTYSVSAAVGLFGDALRTARLLGIDLAPFRQQVVNFLPFAYTEQLALIFEILGSIRPDEWPPLIAVYRDKTSDLWKHQTSNFIDAVEQHHVLEAVPILKGFVEDAECTPHVRERALRVLESLTPDQSFLSSIFDKYQASTLAHERTLAHVANGILISQHGDEVAHAWRIEEVLRRAAPFKKPTGVHTVSDLEAEVTHGMSFAQPLMAFGRRGYEDRYFTILDQAMAMWAKGPDYHAYAAYLWNVVCGHFELLKSHRSYDPLRLLEQKIDEMKALDGANWLAGRMGPLRRSYLKAIGRPTNISRAITRYNDARRDQTERILTSADLYGHLHEAMDTELRRWIEGEGGYKLILGEKVTVAKKQDYEKLIQKTLKTQIENILLRRGFKVDVIREPDLLDEMRTDCLVRCGFAGPIVMEIKLTSHPDAQATDITSTKSYRSMAHYMAGYGASYGLLVAIANEMPDRLEKLARGFRQIRGVGTIGFDLTKDAMGSRSAKRNPSGPARGRRVSKPVVGK
jgi:hypothetical protein